MATNEEIVAAAQQLYVSYYGRPADPAGLTFWTAEFTNSDNVDAALEAFGTSAEYTALANGLSNEALVNLLYNQMFNRDGDTEGVAFYVGELASGDSTLASIALDIANGALGADVTTLANKVTVANTFTTDVEADSAPYTDDDIAAARALLDDVDATAASVTAGNTAASALVDDLGRTTDPAVAYTLTAGIDIIESGSGDDTYAATSPTLGANDIITDSSTDDDDTLSIVHSAIAATAAASISGVENISVEIDAFVGARSSFDATNVKGASITLWSDKLGFDGDAAVVAGGDNAIVAGSNVGDINVTLLNDGSVDLGSATMATITTVAGLLASARVGPTITVNGDVASITVDSGGAVKAPSLTINATAAATVPLTAAAGKPLFVTGDGAVNLALLAGVDGANVTNNLTSGRLNVVSLLADTAANVADIDADSITFAANLPFGLTGQVPAVTGVDGKTFIIATDQTAGQSYTGATAATGTVAVTSIVDLTGALTFASLAGATLTVVDDADGDGRTLANLAADDVPTVVNSTADLTVTTTNGRALDFSGVSGDLTVMATTANANITGGSGANTILPGASTTSYTGGAGVDTVVATGIMAATLAAETGAGNDIVVLAGPTGTVAIDGGAGIDTLALVNGTGTAATTLTLANVEVVAVVTSAGLMPTGDTTPDDDITATLSAAQLSGESYTVIAADATDNLIVTVTGAATDTVIDLGSLTPSAMTEFMVNGTDNAQTITGTSRDDTINAGGRGTNDISGNTITGGGGDNTYVFAADDTGAGLIFDSITDYTTGTTAAAGIAEDNDEIDLASGEVAANVAVTVLSGTNAVNTSIATIFAGAENVVRASVTNGVLSLTGLAADRALANTLAEYVQIALALSASASVAQADVVAFEFDGNTYVLEDTAGNSTVGAAFSNANIDNLIELTGVTGITAVSSTAAGDNTILIA